MKQALDIAIIGSGKIVAEALPVISQTKGLHIRSLWTRQHSLEHAQAMAEPYDIPIVTTDYAAVIADTQTDVVYIGLINSAHYTFALRALEAGKHVILEKPACLCANELRHLAEEANRRQLMILEAVTLLHLPAFQLLRDELLPQIGNVRHLECNYSQRSSRLDSYLQGIILPAFDPAAGGGALMDINVYNLHFTLALMGSPTTAHYVCRRGPNGVDLSGTAILEYTHEESDGKVIALCTGSKESDAPSFGLIQGERGWLRVEGSVSTMAAITLCLRGEAPREIALEPVSHRLEPEFRAFADILARRDFATAGRLLAHSISVLEVVDRLRSNAE